MGMIRHIIQSHWIISIAFAALLGLMFSYILEFIMIKALPIAETLRQIFLVSNQNAGLLTELLLNALIYAVATAIICCFMIPILNWGISIRTIFYPIVMSVAIAVDSIWLLMVSFFVGFKEQQLIIVPHIAVSLFAIILVILAWSYFYIHINVPNKPSQQDAQKTRASA